MVVGVETTPRPARVPSLAHMLARRKVRPEESVGQQERRASSAASFPGYKSGLEEGIELPEYDGSTWHYSYQTWEGESHSHKDK